MLEHKNLCQKIVGNFCAPLINSISVYLPSRPYRWNNLTQLLFSRICHWFSFYTHENLWEQHGKLCKSLLIAKKRACILQCKVSVTFVNSNYLCQRTLNLSILAEKMKKNSELVLMIMQGQCGKELSTRKQDRDMFPRYLYSSQMSEVTETTPV